MERIHGGDKDAFGELLRQQWNPLVAYAVRFVSCRDEAEDVVQEALLRIWRFRDRWTPTDRLRSLLYRTTRNLALNEQTKTTARRRRETVGLGMQAVSPATPLEIAEKAELDEAVALAINSLPPKRREVYVLSRYHGHTYAEIADIMDISPQTVANQMSSALEELREKLEPRVRHARQKNVLRVVRGSADDAPTSTG